MRRQKVLKYIKIIILCMVMSILPVINVNAANFLNRDVPPDNNSIYYLDNNGYMGYTMPNCTAYVYGRLYELNGVKPNMSHNSAYKVYTYNTENNIYDYSPDAYSPKLGAIVCYTDSGNGHVQIIEEIGEDDNGKYICASESNYSGRYSGKEYKAFNYIKIYIDDLNASKTSGWVKWTYLEDNDGYDDESTAEERNGVYLNFQGYVYAYTNNEITDSADNVTNDNEQNTSGKGEETHKKYIYFGHRIISRLNNAISEELENNDDGIYELDGNMYKVTDGNVYSIIPIKWQVLRETDDTLLLIQDYVFTGHNFSDSMEGTEVSWENSDVRKYLNDTYYNSIFTEQEKNDIVAYTDDKLFLPSEYEIRMFFPTEEGRRAHYYEWNTPDVTTPIIGFGIGRAYNKTDYTCAYWTRSASKINYSFSQPTYVTCDGYVLAGGRVYNTWSSGIRPMMYIRKDSTNYYNAPESVSFSTDEQIVIYAGTDFEQPIYADIKGGDSYQVYVTRGSVNTSSIGVQRLWSHVFGEDPEMVVLETKLYVKPAIEKISVSAQSNNEKPYLKLTWSNAVKCEAYEIMRSTSEDGEYEVIYSGKVSYKINGDSYDYCYDDSTAVQNQEYWYKIRGLWPLWSSSEKKCLYLTERDGIESDFSDSVCGKIESTTPNNTTGWVEENGEQYWYEDGVKQGTEGRGKEIYDPDSDAWYWLDSVDGGKKAVSKDVYQESYAGRYADNEDGTGKWVRYDENGHMVKGWNNKDGNTYYFDLETGAMYKGYATIDGIEYYFSTVTGALERTIGEVPENGWKNIDGADYWYENYERQGCSPRSEYRGKEIYDPDSDAWYWLDNVDGGKKAVGKDVYQESLAGEWGDSTNENGEKIGKWVRYDENGHMIKGWSTTNAGTYYFDPIYGTMAKGTAVIDGVVYYFDQNTGVLQ